MTTLFPRELLDLTVLELLTPLILVLTPTLIAPAATALVLEVSVEPPAASVVLPVLTVLTIPTPMSRPPLALPVSRATALALTAPLVPTPVA